MLKNAKYAVVEDGVEVEYFISGHTALSNALDIIDTCAEFAEEGLSAPKIPHVKVVYLKTGAVEWDSQDECTHPEYKVLSERCTAMATLEQPPEYYVEVSCKRCGFVGEVEEVHEYARQVYK